MMNVALHNKISKIKLSVVSVEQIITDINVEKNIYGIVVTRYLKERYVVKIFRYLMNK